MINLTSESTKEISKALSIAQSKITNVTKDKAGYGYKYAELASCLEVIKTPLTESELAFTQLTSILESGQPVLISMLLHSSGEWIRSILHLNAQGSKQMNDTQALGSAITYLRRYALCAMFGIAQEDDDGDSAGAKREDKKKEQSLDDGASAGAKKEDKKKEQSLPAELPISPIRKLIDLCIANAVDVEEFTGFHNIKSKNPESVDHAIANFQTLLDVFNGHD